MNVLDSELYRSRENMISLFNKNIILLRDTLTSRFNDDASYGRIGRLWTRLNNENKYAELISGLENYGYNDILEYQEYTSEQQYNGTLSEDDKVAFKKVFMNMVIMMIRTYMDRKLILNFTDEEVDFIIGLHFRVLSGDLDIESPFTVQGLMR